MSIHDKYDEYFTPATALEAEGARIGVANCRICGAAVLLDPRDEINYARLHGEWHDELAAACDLSGKGGDDSPEVAG